MKILVVAGEASADLHAAHLVEHLRRALPVSLIGIGGDHLVREGLAPIFSARDMAVVGLTEALKKIPQTLRLLGSLEKLAAEQKPDIALLLDLPDFNLRLAPRLKKLGVPVVYFASPQVWAWRSGRVKSMAKCIDLLLSILPFEEAWYRDRAPGFPIRYVGHPAVSEIPDEPYAPEENHLVLMPGSRDSEWRNLFGDFVSAAALLHRENPALRFTLPMASTMKKSPLAGEFLSEEGPYGPELVSLGKALTISDQPAHVSLRRARAALIASGTATLEAAIVGTPMVVAYRVNPTTAFLFKHLVRYEGAISVVNLVHYGLNSPERLVPEILQESLTPENLAASLRQVAKDPQWSLQRNKLAETRKILSRVGDPLETAARVVLEFCQQRGAGK